MTTNTEAPGGYATLQGIVDPSLLNGHAETDAALIARLHEYVVDGQWTYAPDVELIYANAELAAEVSSERTLEERVALEDRLLDRGTTHIPVIEGNKLVIDGEEREIAIVAATDTDSNHGEMSTKFYLRDQVQAAAALMELALQDPKRYREEGELGRSLLISSLDFMSTPDQHERFRRIIETRQGGQEDWPHILADFEDLATAGPNGWRNIQDSFQMLTYLTFDALNREFISVDYLTNANKQFLASVMPFMEAVGFPKYESSGSWEEVCAIRTSVMAVETAMLHKLQELREKDIDLSFIEDGYKSAQQFLPEFEGSSFDEALETVVGSGLREIGRRIPFESADPEYKDNPVKYREADSATLAYLLLYDLPDLLASRSIPIGEKGEVMTAEQIEVMILRQIATLFDPETNGIFRYLEDSYQREDFHLMSIQVAINALKARVKEEAAHEGHEVDLDEKQRIRGQIVPKGRQAAWNLGNEQFASWAGKRSILALEKGEIAAAEFYDGLSTEFMNYSLSHVTGYNQWHMVLGEDGSYRIQQVPADRMPECLVTYTYVTAAGDKASFIVPSPHVPLNWGSAMLRLAAGLQVVYSAKQLELAQAQ